MCCSQRQQDENVTLFLNHHLFPQNQVFLFLFFGLLSFKIKFNLLLQTDFNLKAIFIYPVLLEL